MIKQQMDNGWLLEIIYLVYDGYYGHYGHADGINKDAEEAINNLEHEGCDSERTVMNVIPVLFRTSHACASGLWSGWGSKSFPRSGCLLFFGFRLIELAFASAI
jgi:hypothetical protein